MKRCRLRELNNGKNFFTETGLCLIECYVGDSML